MDQQQDPAVGFETGQNQQPPDGSIGAPAATPGEVEQKTFNEADRQSVMDSYKVFQEAELKEFPVQPAAPPAQPDTAQAATAPETPPSAPSTPPPPKYKSIEEAERAASEAARKMHEATQQTKRLQEDFNRFRSDVLQSLRSQGQQQQQPQQPPTPQKSPEEFKAEMEAAYYQDPVGFQIGLIQHMMGQYDAVTAQREQERRQQDQQQRLMTAYKAAGDHAHEHFRNTHKDLVMLENEVTSEMAEVWKDQDLVRNIAMNSQSANETASKLVDEAAKRVRSRVPDIIQSLGYQSGVSRERLSGPGVGQNRARFTPTPPPAPPPAAPTPEQYIQSRINWMNQRFNGNAG